MRNLLIFPELVKKFIRSFHRFNRLLSPEASVERPGAAALAALPPPPASAPAPSRAHLFAFNWVLSLQNFKTKMQNTSKIPNFQNALKYHNTSKNVILFQIFRILVRKFFTFSGVFRRFPLIFLKERGKCFKKCRLCR